MSRFKRLLAEQLDRLRKFTLENGQTLVEYGIIIMLLALVVIGTLTVVGEEVTSLFTGVSSDFQEIENRTP